MKESTAIEFGNNYIIPNWPAPKNVRAYTTTRQQGFSKSPFHHFNLGLEVGDDPAAVAANRKKLAEDLNLPASPNWSPIWPKQVHSTEAACAELCATRPTADAIYTHTSNTVCAINTADCLPLLVCNQQGTEAAAIHAGWRGLVAGVIENTLRQLKSPGEELLVWLGPAIGPSCFEVGDEVYQQFIAVDANAAVAFSQHKPLHWMADLYQLARQRLQRCNVTQIFGGEYCTYQNSELFYSYRRDKGHTGRMASLIWLAK